MTEPRAHTVEEMRDLYLNHVRAMAVYWSQVPDRTPLEMCNGLAFSLLVALDGGVCSLPAFNLVPSPHPEDKAYHKAEGTNWYPENVVINDCQLHEMFYKKDT